LRTAPARKCSRNIKAASFDIRSPEKGRSGEKSLRDLMLGSLVAILVFEERKDIEG
jgi:hypothetical protein